MPKDENGLYEVMPIKRYKDRKRCVILQFDANHEFIIITLEGFHASSIYQLNRGELDEISDSLLSIIKTILGFNAVDDDINNILKNI